MAEGPLDRLAAYATGLRLDDEVVLAHALVVIRDTLGTMLAGLVQSENAALAANAGALGGPGRATVVGRDEGTVPHIAALVNGTAAVTLELDEGNQFATHHPAVHVLPAALAMAEQRGRSGRALLEAFVAGYEVAVRVARVTRLRDPVHPFGTTAITGAVAAAARLEGLDARGTAAAMRLAVGTVVASSQSAANAGASVRSLSTGLTGHHGVLAVSLVQAGFAGEPHAPDAVFGRVLGDHFDAARLDADLDRFFITRNYFKTHACSRWNHAPIEAAAALMTEEPVEPQAVTRVVVWTFDPATRLDGRDPPNGYAAKHSIPYNVAVRFVCGTNGLEAYSDETVADPLVRQLAERVEVREDPAFTAAAPELRIARVELTLADGRVRTATVERAPGGHDNPYDEATLQAKFRDLAGRALAPEAVQHLAQAVHDLPRLSNLSALTSPLRSARP